MDKLLYLSFVNLFNYLGATPSSRCVQEGQAVVNANHIITCGITSKTEILVNIFALCLQTSALAQKPHEITGTLMRNKRDVDVSKFLCTCKAGMSGQCKHVAAVLLLCTRSNILEFAQLSTTDMQCYWDKRSATEKYAPAPLSDEGCFKTVSTSLKTLSESQSVSLFEKFISTLPESALAKHRCGRKNNDHPVTDRKIYNVQQLQNLNILLDNCRKPNVFDQLPSPFFVNECCRKKYEELIKNVNVADIAQITKIDIEKWGVERQYRITGSRCYGIYTYSQQLWEQKSTKYFWPKSLKNKYTEYGKQHENAARILYANNNKYEVLETGLIISEKQPWVGYTPDGIVYQNNVPTKLLEIKCPYSGKEEPAINFIKTCSYIEFRDNVLSLKKKHMYYGQIQLGMALLNLPECDFILYSSHSKSFLNIIVKYDEVFAKDMLNKLHYNYFMHMIHVICNKNEFVCNK